MKNILRYTGNMSNVNIRNYINNNIELYVEPFAGSFGCGFNIMEQGYMKEAILNDKDYYVYNFWRCIKEDYNRVIDNINMIYEALLNVDINHIINKLDNCKYSEDRFMQAAYEYMYAENRYMIHSKKEIKRINIKEEDFIDASIRLMNVDVLNTDYIDIINMCDSDNTFFMIDPPYHVKNINKYYRGNCKEFNHEELREIVRNTKGKWIVRYNDEELANSLYSDTNELFRTNHNIAGVNYTEIYYSNII